MTRPRYTVFASGAPTLGLALGVGGVLAVALAAWPYTVDDAFITARYACNLASGRGYAMNAHSPSDGVTGPLWLLPQVLACAAGVDPLLVAKVAGLCCTLIAVWIALRALAARAGGQCATWAAAIVMATSPSLGTWAVAGLETGAATLLVTLAALGAVRRPAPAPLQLGVACALLAWLRPELAACAAVLLAVALLRDRRRGAFALAIAGVGALSMLAFRAALFGDALPLALHAKGGSLAQGFEYCVRGAVLVTSLAGVALVARAAQRGQARDRALAAALLAHCIAVVLAGGDWMPGYRLLVPLLPLYAMLAGVGVARGFVARRTLGALLLAVACTLPVIDLVTRIPDLRASAGERRAALALAAWLRAHARSAALVDVGLIGYSSRVEIIDLAGLTDPAIARMPGGHLDKRIDADHLRARDPDAIVLHSSTPPRVSADRRLLAFDGFGVERRVAALAFVRAHYRVDHVVHRARDYEYIVLVRDRNARDAPQDVKERLR